MNGSRDQVVGQLRRSLELTENQAVEVADSIVFRGADGTIYEYTLKNGDYQLIPPSNVVPGVITFNSLPFELLDADIKQLPVSDFEVIPAPGPNKVVLVMGGLAVLDETAGIYTNISGSHTLRLNYEGGAGPCEAASGNPFWGAFGPVTNPVIVDFPGSFSATAPALNQLFSVQGFLANDVADAVNKSVGLSLSTGFSGALTDGNAANRMKGIVAYITLDLG